MNIYEFLQKLISFFIYIIANFTLAFIIYINFSVSYTHVFFLQGILISILGFTFKYRILKLQYINEQANESNNTDPDLNGTTNKKNIFITNILPKIKNLEFICKLKKYFNESPYDFKKLLYKLKELKTLATPYLKGSFLNIRLHNTELIFSSMLLILAAF